MDRPRVRAVRRSVLLLGPALLAVVAVGCGGDDDDASDTVVVVIGGTGAETTASSSDDDDDDQPVDTRDYPSLDEVGRAEFTHTIVAGDFLRSIADTYDVEIDDIVGANEWDDGRDHLLLPGDVIYLPADAVMPPATSEATSASDSASDVADESDDSPDADGVAAADAVCSDGQLADTYMVVDTLEAAVSRLSRLDLSVRDLEVVNRYGVNGVPGFEPGEVWVPCVASWPQQVGFWNLADPIRCVDGSIQGTYTVAPGEDSPSIAARFGATEAELQAENPGFEIWWSDPGSFAINVCMSWFEA